MTDFLWLVFDIAMHYFRGFIVARFLDHVLIKKDRTPAWSTDLCTLCYTIGCTLYLFFPIPGSDTWLMILPLLYAVCFFKNSLLQKVFWTSIAFLCSTGIHILLMWILQIPLNMLELPSWSHILHSLASNFLLRLVLLALPKIIRTPLEKPLPLIFFVSIIFLLIIVMDAQLAISSYTEEMAFGAQFSGVLVLVITLLTVILYTIMAHYVQEASEKRILEMQIQQEKQHIAELNEVSESLRSLRHDMINHLHIAADLMQQGKNIEGSQYLNTVESHILHIFSTGCPALDSALYLKESRMQQHDILFRAAIQPIASLPTTIYDICTIISNLLDNAIEARGRFPVPPADYTITLSMHRKADMLYIEVTNPVHEPSLRLQDGRYQTLKPEPGHGLGIAAVEKILDRLNAHREFGAENGIFRVFLALPYLDEIDIHLSHEKAVLKERSAVRKYQQTQNWFKL